MPQAPYGTWPSPITPALMGSGAANWGDVATDGDVVWFTRSAPDGPEARLHRWTADDGVVRVAEHLDVRSQVHEYGGGAIAAGHDVAVVCEFSTQQLHVVEADGSSRALPTADDSSVRFAAGVLVDDSTMIAVREVHDGAPADPVRNELVAVDLVDGSQRALVSDADFVGDPALGPGGRLAWTTWMHPNMPWDRSTLWSGRWDGAALVEVAPVVDRPDTSVATWAWRGPALWWADDRTGWWEVWRDERPGGVRVTDLRADAAGPRWRFGRHTIATTASDDIGVVVTRAGHGRLAWLDVDGHERPATGPDEVVAELHGADSGVVAAITGVDGSQRLTLVRAQGGRTVIDEIPPVVHMDVAPDVRAIEVPVDDAVTHAFLHLPANDEWSGPSNEAPPLVVFVHGGPTSHVGPVSTASHRFWTSRGFAVVDCNYRGSTGFGRDYRRAMRGRWGEVEVADAVAVAAWLGDEGLVDADRMVIRGGSAGGFTALAAVARTPSPFAAATSFFGVADLAALAAHTHKFESRYLDSMVGDPVADADVYERRSPLSHLDEVAVPILVLQGGRDRVVPQSQADTLVDGLAARGVPHAYVVFPDEGHGFRDPGAIESWLGTELAFYGRVLGFEPSGDLPEVPLRGPNLGAHGGTP